MASRYPLIKNRWTHSKIALKSVNYKIKYDYLGMVEGKEKDEWLFFTFIIAIMKEIGFIIILFIGKRDNHF